MYFKRKQVVTSVSRIPQKREMCTLIKRLKRARPLNINNSCSNEKNSADMFYHKVIGLMN